MRDLRSAALRVTTPLDLSVAGVLAVLAGWETVAAGGDQVVLRSTLAVLTALALVPRRKAPMLSALLVAVGLATESLATESPDETAILLTLLVSAFSTARHLPTREAATGLTLLSLAVAITIAVDPSDSLGNVAPTILLFVLLPAGAGLALRRRSRDLAVLGLQAKALADEAGAAVDAERRRIARELHDVVSHAVTLIAVQAEAGQAVIDRDPESARRSLAAISAASRDAVAELQSMLTLLRDAPGEQVEVGLSGLPTLVDGAREAGLRVDVQHRSGIRLSPAADHCAYRVVQEGLTNALRHLSRAEVQIEISDQDDAVRVEVRSVGSVHQSAYGGSGRGLAGLRERVLNLGGAFESTTDPGGAHRISAILPAAT